MQYSEKLSLISAVISRPHEQEQTDNGLPETSRPSTPGPSNSQPAYSESPTKEKRKKMEELAQMRLQKRQRKL